MKIFQNERKLVIMLLSLIGTTFILFLFVVIGFVIYKFDDTIIPIIALICMIALVCKLFSTIYKVLQRRLK